MESSVFPPVDSVDHAALESSSRGAVFSGDLVEIVSPHSTAIQPSEDAIVLLLNGRFRSDLPFTRIGTTTLLLVNPYKTLANTNDITAKEYEERCYRDTNLALVYPTPPVQPHVYELAAKIYLLMRRRKESQSIVTRGILGSGKSFSGRLLIDQLLRLSAHSKKELTAAAQIKAVALLLDAFGNAKTIMNANASRHSRYIELHFSDRGRMIGAKFHPFGLEKARLNRLSREERTYHIFYHFLAGANAEEREQFKLEGPSDYSLLASSGSYRLPAGPLGDDASAMEDVRAAMKTLGFKVKNMTSIFATLSAILLMGNLKFTEADAKDVSAQVTNTDVLEHIAHFLGVSVEGFAQILTNKTCYGRKELYTVLLNTAQSKIQRDQFARDLYAILFAYIVESSNSKLSPGDTALITTRIALLDLPGFQTRRATDKGSSSFTGSGPLVWAYGQNTFDELCINFTDELVHAHVIHKIFDDTSGYYGKIIDDGVELPAISMAQLSCVDILRGSGLVGNTPGGILGMLQKIQTVNHPGPKKEEVFIQSLYAALNSHPCFIATDDAPNSHSFAIQHYAGSCSYDTTGLIEKDADMLDAALISLLRTSSNPFFKKLVSGPSLALETHHQDESMIVQAQVSSRPLRPITSVSFTQISTASQGEAKVESTKIHPVTTQLYETLTQIFSQLDRTRIWSILCIRPNDSGTPNSFDKSRVKAQIRSLCIPELVLRRRVEFVVDFTTAEFCDRYVPTMQGSESERIRQCAAANGWTEGTDYVVGREMIWLSYTAWKMVEDGVRAVERERKDKLGHSPGGKELFDVDDQGIPMKSVTGHVDDCYESNENLLLPELHKAEQNSSYGLVPLPSSDLLEKDDNVWDLEQKGGQSHHMSLTTVEEGGLTFSSARHAVEERPTTSARRTWLFVVWMLSGWIPTSLLHRIGRMKREDIRQAWREKVAIFALIFFMNAIVIFYIVQFGRLLCPNFDTAWATNEVAQHTGNNDFWVAIQGKVYDVSNFVRGDHSDIIGDPSNPPNVLSLLAGQDLTNYFPPPLILACSALVSESRLQLTYKNFTPLAPSAMHTSGATQSVQNTKLDQPDWYTANFLPKIKQYLKGELVWDTKTIIAQAADKDIQRYWAIWENGVYDLTDYINTVTINQGATSLYNFLSEEVVAVFQQQAGQDITHSLNQAFAGLDPTTKVFNLDCLKNMFYIGEADFRKTPRCQVQNYMLLAFTSILIASMVLKFISALQLSGKPSPENIDKFVVCQVPCYTEGEDSLRRTIDSLAALKYDDKRKLLFVICDGNIIGSGNDRTTPRIVLDIFGVDPKVDPEPLMFKSIGEGLRQINYGKVYSGLYEFEGHVVPYLVVVKVGKPTERSKPGNRGKRDSQILLLHYLNRVHFDAPMSPLELEICFQMRSIIGIDPAFYEYIFTVDADTSVESDSLNRLVAAAADDSSIIGICGETKLMNEEGSWWTMIQVYEYYISHHLSKAFESLFGSVSCLPGCFSLYRIRTADRGRPVIISNHIIEEYADCNVDTLHKKNLFSLGEDRFLTTLLLKYFPTFKTKFIPDAVAHTMAPESWRVLFSQRRRWINSTIHNLCELVMLPELCGFCCFSMRFFVFIDLLSTIILPATVVYLVYLIVVVATGHGALPVISIVMLGITYGLQAIIFILKREFMLVGWMIVYLLSYPVYSFFLPVYSFWCMDDFTWGNTRLVIGEGGSKKVIIAEEETFDDSMIPMKRFDEYEAQMWEGGPREWDQGSKREGFVPRAVSPSPADPGRMSPAWDPRNSVTLFPGFLKATHEPKYSQADHIHHRHASMPPCVQSIMSPYDAHLSTMPFVSFAGGPTSARSPGYVNQLPLAFSPARFGHQHSMSLFGAPSAQSRASMIANLSPYQEQDPQAGASAGAHPLMPTLTGNQRPMSAFSMATMTNLFASPSTNTNPTDEDLYMALRNYLSTQNLMMVTKKTTREAVAAQFPRADLTSRKDFLNRTIDRILSQP